MKESNLAKIGFSTRRAELSVQASFLRLVLIIIIHVVYALFRSGSSYHLNNAKREGLYGSFFIS